MKKAKHWWSGWTQAQWDEGALCKEEEVGRDPGPLRSGGAGSRAGRQAHGGEVGVEALAVCRVGGGAGKAASPKGPCKVAGGSGRAGAAAAGVVAKSTAKGELAGQALGSDWRVQDGDRGWAGGQYSDRLRYVLR